MPVPGEIEKPICCHCKKAVLAKRSNTTNLFCHLEDHHPEVYAEMARGTRGKGIKRKQPTLLDIIEKSRRYDPKSQRVRELNRAVACFIARDMQPFYTMEKPGFKQMVEMLDSLPSRKYFSETEIPRLYSELKDDVVKPAVKSATYFTATTDLWTSSARHPYLSFTVHFIDDNWELRSYCLDTVPPFEDHTGQNLAEAAVDILGNWELQSENLVCTTTDNGSNFIAAFQTLEWPRISCFGHNLDLAVNKALNIERVQQAIRRCHALVEVFSRSWKKYRDLRQKQTELGLKQKKLISDVVTRWGSTYQMIARILEQQQAICAVPAEDRKNWHQMPSDHEFSVLEAVDSVLRPLHVFTDALSGEKYITISAIRPLLKHIVEDVLAVASDDCAIIREMKETISDKLQAHYIQHEASDLLDKCSFLDPRFRADYLANEEETLSQLTTEAHVIAEKLSTATDKSEVEEVATPAPKKLKGLGAVLKKALKEKSSEPLSTPARIEKEISCYRDLLFLSPDGDPLQWWKTEAKRLPILATLARKYLCVCGTSVPSERLFSKAGYIVNNLRTHLSPDNVNRLVFLSRNMS